MGFKALIIDIETMPALALVWGSNKQFVGVDQILEDTHVACFAAKWAHEKEIMFFSEWDGGRNKMVRKAYKLMEEADAWVHYNGKSFDIPHLNWEFFQLGMKPPAPKPQVDMFRTCEKLFRPVSRRLAFIGPAAGVGKKIEHEGMPLWVKVHKGEWEARKRMELYCCGDISVENGLYKRMIPWFGSQHPNVSLWSPECGDRPLCHACGSSRLHAHDYRKTKSYMYRRYRCQDCGATPTDRSSMKSVPKPLTLAG